MPTLTPVNSATFKIDNLPYQRGVYMPDFREELGMMRIVYLYDINAPIVNWLSYDSYINGLTGNPFANFAELVDFATNYMYQYNGGQGESEAVGSVISRKFTISDAPANELEKLPGITIDYNANVPTLGWEVVAMRLNNVNIDESEYSTDGAVNKTSLTNGQSFLAGDVVVLLLQKTT